MQCITGVCPLIYFTNTKPYPTVFRCLIIKTIGEKRKQLLTECIFLSKINKCRIILTAVNLIVGRSTEL